MRIRVIVLLLFFSSVALLALFVSQTGSAGSVDISRGWSEDLRITDDSNLSKEYKAHLTVDEASDGHFDLLFTRYYYLTPFEVVSTSTDKIGTPAWNETVIDMPEWRTRFWGNHYRFVYLHHDERTDTIQFVGMDQGSSRHNIEFMEYDLQGKLLCTESIHVKSIRNVPNVHYESFQAKWDENDVIHIACSVEEVVESHVSYKYHIAYIEVQLHPFHISRSLVRSTPPMEHIHPCPLICLTQNRTPVIGHIDRIGTVNYRAISVRDATGNWTTVRFADWSDSLLNNHFSTNGLYVDADDTVHIAYVKSQQGVLYYVTYSIGEGELGPTRSLAWISNSYTTEGIKVEIHETAEGDLLFVLNHCQDSSCHPNVNSPPGKIDLIFAPGGRLDDPQRLTLTLVDNPTASDFRFHIDDDGNMFLFWFDERSGKVELYMRYRGSPGLSIQMDPSEWVEGRFIRPDETRVLDLDLVNVGTVELDVGLCVETNASEGWSVDIDVHSTHLAALSSVPLDLTVHCPPDARHGDWVVVWVNASTANNEFTARFRLNVHVRWVRSIDVSCSDRTHLVEPGGQVRFTFSVQNMGEMAECVSVEPVLHAPGGWSMTRGDGTIQLAAGSSVSLGLNVTCRPSAGVDESGTVVVSFLWDDGATAHEPLVLRCVVLPTFFVTMELNRTRATVGPGEQAMFTATVGNVGNLEGEAFIEVSLLTDPGDWLVLLDCETVLLGPGERGDVELLVGTPPSPTGGDIMIVRVRAYCPNPFSEVVEEVRVVVRSIHSLHWSPTESKMELPPGGSGSRTFTIRNDGNLFETVELRLDGSEGGWLLWTERAGVETGSVRVGPGEEVRVELFARAPPNALAGSHQSRLYLDAAGVTWGSLDLLVHVSEVRDIWAQMSLYQGEAYVGGLLELGIELRNNGNVDELVRLNLTGEDISRVLRCDGENDTCLWLPARSVRSVELVLVVDVRSKLGLHAVQLVAASSSEPLERAVDVEEYQVVRPHVDVSAVELQPGGPSINEVVRVEVTLTNPGAREVTNVSVRLFGSEPEHLASIAPGTDRTVVFIWVPRVPGETELSGSLTYDPGGQTDTWSWGTVVEGDGEDEVLGWFLILPIVLAVAVASLLLLRRGERHPC